MWLYVNAVLQLIAQPLFSVFTDKFGRTARLAMWLLALSIGVELLAEIAMCLLTLLPGNLLSLSLVLLLLKVGFGGGGALLT